VTYQPISGRRRCFFSDAINDAKDSEGGSTHDDDDELEDHALGRRYMRQKYEKREKIDEIDVREVLIVFLPSRASASLYARTTSVGIPLGRASVMNQ
jgi:hypothetical protein